jgi:hypothetical protein
MYLICCLEVAEWMVVMMLLPCPYIQNFFSDLWKSKENAMGQHCTHLQNWCLLFGCTFMSLWLDMGRGKCEPVLLIRALNQFYLQDILILNYLSFSN